jgi:hypothetical protein
VDDRDDDARRRVRRELTYSPTPERERPSEASDFGGAFAFRTRGGAVS